MLSPEIIGLYCHQTQFSYYKFGGHYKMRVKPEILFELL
jgi:hypothetical protein